MCGWEWVSCTVFWKSCIAVIFAYIVGKHWHEGEKSNNLVGYRFCTYVTRVGRACAPGHVFALIRSLVPLHAVVLHSHTLFNGVWLCETTSAASKAACLALCFVLVHSFCSALLADHFENMMVLYWTTLETSLQEHNGSIITYSLCLHWERGACIQHVNVGLAPITPVIHIT